MNVPHRVPRILQDKVGPVFPVLPLVKSDKFFRCSIAPYNGVLLTQNPR
jgi:hypothetical protein